MKRESRKTLVFRSALKALKAERQFFCSSVFLEAGYSGKMGKTKKDTNARVAGRRKEINERAAEQLCMDNISTGLNESEFIGVSVNIPVIAFKFPNFHRTVLFSYLDFFPALFIRVSNFRFFTH